MERGGGFHGYQRFSKSNIGMNLSADISNKNHIDINVACTVREQDRFMPIANVIRIMRKVLPNHAKISDDAKETIQECVSEYISFITSEANDRCQREQRKTITAEDVLWAMSKLGFDEYVDPLTTYLQRYREFEGDRGSIRVDSYVKRTVDLASITTVSAPFHHHHMVATSSGFFVAAAGLGTQNGGGSGSVQVIGDYFREGSGSVNSATRFDPYASYK